MSQIEDIPEGPYALCLGNHFFTTDEQLAVHKAYDYFMQAVNIYQDYLDKEEKRLDEWLNSLSGAHGSDEPVSVRYHRLIENKRQIESDINFIRFLREECDETVKTYRSSPNIFEAHLKNFGISLEMPHAEIFKILLQGGDLELSTDILIALADQAKAERETNKGLNEDFEH